MLGNPKIESFVIVFSNQKMPKPLISIGLGFLITVVLTKYESMTHCLSILFFEIC